MKWFRDFIDQVEGESLRHNESPEAWLQALEDMREFLDEKIIVLEEQIKIDKQG